MNPIALSLMVAVGAIAGTGLVVFFVPMDQILDAILTNGPALLIILQVAGIFYAGMTSNVRLGLLLIGTVLATVILGW